MGTAAPLRILMIHNRYRNVGGEDISTDTQIELLRAAGHEVVLIEDSNERVEQIGKVRVALRSVWSPDARQTVDDELAAKPFNVVHVQNFFPMFSPSIYYAARRHGVPVVQSLRNFRLLCPEGMLYRDGGECTDCAGRAVAWPAVVHRCYRGSALGSASIATMAGLHKMAGTWRNRVQKYVAPTDFTRGVFVAAGWNSSAIEVIPNFVYPDPGVGPGNGGFALYAGRLAPVKGIETLLRAWRDIGIDYPLRIAGDGPLRPEVEAVAAADPNVEYVGPVAADDVVELMGLASFVVAPTLGIESFGRVVVEAMAKGTPSLVADHGGLRETAPKDRPELAFGPGDADELAVRVRHLVGESGLLDRLRAEARAGYLANYSGERVLAAWIDLYRAAATPEPG